MIGVKFPFHACFVSHLCCLVSMSHHFLSSLHLSQRLFVVNFGGEKQSQPSENPAQLLSETVSFLAANGNRTSDEVLHFCVLIYEPTSSPRPNELIILPGA